MLSPWPSLLVFALAAGAYPPAAEPAPQDPPAPPAWDPPAFEEETLPPLERGVLPEGTQDATRVLWREVLDATLGPDREAGQPVQAFQARFEMTTRDGVRTNQLKILHRFLEPGYVRYELQSGNEEGRDAQGYWLRADGEVQRLVGREYATDREAIEQRIAISRNLLVLGNPGSMRLRSIATEKRRPDGLPRDYLTQAAKLRWLSIQSPDLALPTGDSSVTQGDVRLRLGVDREGLPMLALLDRPTVPGVPPSAPVLMVLGNYRELDGYTIPHAVLVHLWQLPPAGALGGVLAGQLAPKPNLELFILAGNLRPELKPEDFRPTAPAR